MTLVLNTRSGNGSGRAGLGQEEGKGHGGVIGEGAALRGDGSGAGASDRGEAQVAPGGHDLRGVTAAHRAETWWLTVLC